MPNQRTDKAETARERGQGNKRDGMMNRVAHEPGIIERAVSGRWGGSPTRVRAEMGSWQAESTETRALLQKSLAMAPIRNSAQKKHLLWQRFQKLCCPQPLGWGQCRLGMGGDKYQHSESFCLSLCWDPCHLAFIKIGFGRRLWLWRNRHWNRAYSGCTCSSLHKDIIFSGK